MQAKGPKLKQDSKNWQRYGGHILKVYTDHVWLELVDFFSFQIQMYMYMSGPIFCTSLYQWVGICKIFRFFKFHKFIKTCKKLLHEKYVKKLEYKEK